MKREGKRRVRASTLRVLSALGVAALVCLGLALHTGTGTPSSFGIADIAALCPLGGVEAAIASRTVVPPLLIGLAMVIVLTLLLGRAFCAWGCPVPLLRRVFRGKKASKRDASSRDSGPLDVPASERGGLRDSRNWVLGGAILSTAAFGFPVFCLVCPVGLTFGTLVVVWRVFQFNEVTWSLLVFPAMLVLEIGSAAEMVPSVLSAGSAAVVGVARQPHVPAAGERRDVLACGSRRALPSVRRRVPGRHRLA